MNGLVLQCDLRICGWWVLRSVMQPGITLFTFSFDFLVGHMISNGLELKQRKNLIKDSSGSWGVLVFYEDTGRDRWIPVITELAGSGTRLTKKRIMIIETCRRHRKHQGANEPKEYPP